MTVENYERVEYEGRFYFWKDENWYFADTNIKVPMELETKLIGAFCPVRAIKGAYSITDEEKQRRIKQIDQYKKYLGLDKGDACSKYEIYRGLYKLPGDRYRS